MALADYQTLVDKMVRDESGAILSADRDTAIELARLRYSQDVERDLTEDVTWAATGYYGPLPESWADGAWIRQAEYPIGRQPLELIDMALYVDTALGQRLAVPYALGIGSVVRVTYAAPHLLADGDEPADTIPPVHREAVASYAAHVLCKQLATKYSGERDASIGADGSNTESRARNYAWRAKEYRAAYFAGIGKVDPLADKSGGAGGGSGGDAAASVSAWPGRTRNSLTRGVM
ncbi:MAG: hypothetical protein KF796_19620 [Ramlibacter sp.]|nr:hypothetical protein [Ramlibacter sp.]